MTVPISYSREQIAELLRYATPAEKRELDRLLGFRTEVWAPLAGPQLQAYESLADITGYGGAAGGGKTDLVAGLTLTRHERTLIVRREKAQTEGVVQRLTEILGGTTGYNSQKGFWRFDFHRLCEFAGLDNPGDERRWQGRAHDLKAFDEVTEMREQQVRFMLGWLRTSKKSQRARALMTFNPPTTADGRWVLDFFGPWLNTKHPLYPTPAGVLRYAAMVPDGRGGSTDIWLDTGDPFVLVNGAPVYDFDPTDYRPEDIVTPKSRTFIPARVTDNPYYMESGYMSTLQALPEPLRSQMLYGNFQAGIKDDPWQVIPTAWVEAAQARWKPRLPVPRMDSMGVDVARGGKDNTTIARRHGWWWDELLEHPGTDTPDGPRVAGLVIVALRDRAPVHIDVIGVGSSPYDFLRAAGQQVVGINHAEKDAGTDKSGRLRFLNQRSADWWRMREALDPTANNGIELPPGKEILAELTAPRWKPQGVVIQVESREEIIDRIGRSPDRATAIILALRDTPRMADLPGAHEQVQREYDPYQSLNR